FPSIALVLDASLGRHAHATGGARLGPRREAAAALALLLREYRDPIGVRVLIAARNPAFETPYQVRGNANLHIRRQLVQASQKPVQQPELLLRELRRPGLDGLVSRLRGPP